MWERPFLLWILIGMTLCIMTIWHITIQQSQMLSDRSAYTNQISRNVGNDTLILHSSVAGAAAVATASFPSSVGESYPSSISAAAYEHLTKNDFETLIDLDNFEFLINQRSCAVPLSQTQQTTSSTLSTLLLLSSSSSATSSSVLSIPFINENEQGNIHQSPSSSSSSSPSSSSYPVILILIHTAPRNVQKRKIIRNTWGKLDKNSRLLFLVGMVNETEQQQQLINENNVHMDMIQGNFMDAYRNMTYKHMMGLKWFTYYCQDAKFLIKSDDDIFVNIPNLYNFIIRELQLPNTKSSSNSISGSSISSSNSKNIDRGYYDYQYLLNNSSSIYCYKIDNARVARSYRSKWRLSPLEYRPRTYPPYCPGFGIIYSADAVFKLYHEAQKNPYFWIDDVHLTGTMTQLTNVTIVPINDLILTRDQIADILNDYMDINEISFLFTKHDLTDVEVKLLWYLVNNNNS